MFLVRLIAAYSIVLGLQGGTMTDSPMLEASFRALFILGGLLALFGSQLGIYVLATGFLLSVPNFAIGSFHWSAPIILIRFVFGFGSNSPDGPSFYAGADWVAWGCYSLLSRYADHVTLNTPVNQTDSEDSQA